VRKKEKKMTMGEVDLETVIIFQILTGNCVKSLEKIYVLTLSFKDKHDYKALSLVSFLSELSFGGSL
jgi:hypothetical protein